MQCPRCGGDMSSGVCEECGFPINRKCPNRKHVQISCTAFLRRK